MNSDAGNGSWRSRFTVITVSSWQGGIGSSAFADMADHYRITRGSLLDPIFADHGVQIEPDDRIYCAGFSAYHGLLNQILFHEGERVSGAISVDACFSALGQPAKRGYVAYGERAARGKGHFVLTSSAGGGQTFTTGSECAIASVNAAAMNAGVPLEPYDPPAPLPVPTTGPHERAGNLILLDYDRDFTHAGHVHKLAPMLLEVYLNAWVDETENPSPSGAKKGSSAGPLLLVAGAFAAAATAVVVTRRRRRNLTKDRRG
jgi:hypothetical protein